jgi:hypothetical protein
MPSGKKKGSGSGEKTQTVTFELTPDVLEFRVNPELYFSKVLRITGRDSYGDDAIMPLVLRTFQKRVLYTIQARRAFNIFRDARRKNLAGELGAILKALPQTAKDGVSRILALGVDYVLGKIKEKKLPISDGPVVIVIGKPRQTGVSTLCEAILNWRTALWPNTKAMITSLEGASAEAIISINSRFHDFWPDEYVALKPEMPGKARDRLEYVHNSLVEMKTAGGSEIRGFKNDIYHLSEFAHYRDADAIASALIAAPNHVWTLVESTARGPKGAFYEMYKKAMFIDDIIEAYDNKILTGSPFCKVFSSWLEDPEYTTPLEPHEVNHIHETMDDMERMLVERYKATPGQLAWRRDKITTNATLSSKNGLSPEQFFMQEFPNTEDEMFQKTSGEVLPYDVLQRHLSRSEPPKFLFKWDAGSTPQRVFVEALANLKVWELPSKTADYCIGADLSYGLSGRDDTWLSVGRVEEGKKPKIVAEWRGKIQPKDAAQVAATLGEWFHGYKPTAFIMPEINAPGITFCDELVKEIGWTRIYKRRAMDGLASDRDNTFKFGYLTNKNGKQVLIDTIIEALMKDEIVIPSKEGLIQFQTYERDPETGAMDALSGYHDDAIISYALCSFGLRPDQTDVRPPRKTPDEILGTVKEESEESSVNLSEEAKRELTLAARLDGALKDKMKKLEKHLTKISNRGWMG